MRRTGGFTLIEVMITVAILGILAGLLVYNLTKPTKRVKTRSEANAVFAEFHRAQSQYALENGVYYSTGASDADIYPPSPAPQAQDIGTLPDEWDTLRVKPDFATLYCGYVTVAGTRDDAIPTFASDFGMQQPEQNWYVIFARCDQDGSSTLDTTYFSSSVDVSLQRRNEGR